MVNIISTGLVTDLFLYLFCPLVTKNIPVLCLLRITQYFKSMLNPIGFFLHVILVCITVGVMSIAIQASNTSGIRVVVL